MGQSRLNWPGNARPGYAGCGQQRGHDPIDSGLPGSAGELRRRRGADPGTQPGLTYRAAELLQHPVDDAGTVRDVDTPEAYEALRADRLRPGD